MLYCIWMARNMLLGVVGGDGMKLKVLALMIVLPVFICSCMEIDVPIEKTSKVMTVEGDELLHRAGVKTYGGIIKPYKAKRKLKSGELFSVKLTGLYLDVTDDAMPDGDEDDLEFLLSATVYMRSLDEHSELPDIPIAWYERDEAMDDARMVLDFEVDFTSELQPYFVTGFELYSDAVMIVPEDDVSLQAHIRFMGQHEGF